MLAIPQSETNITGILKVLSSQLAGAGGISKFQSSDNCNMLFSSLIPSAR
jgi:hypothetical protein